MFWEYIIDKMLEILPKLICFVFGYCIIIKVLKVQESKLVNYKKNIFELCAKQQGQIRNVYTFQFQGTLFFNDVIFMASWFPSHNFAPSCIMTSKVAL